MDGQGIIDAYQCYLEWTQLEEQKEKVRWDHTRERERKPFFPLLYAQWHGRSNKYFEHKTDCNSFSYFCVFSHRFFNIVQFCEHIFKTKDMLNMVISRSSRRSGGELEISPTMARPRDLRNGTSKQKFV